MSIEPEQFTPYISAHVPNCPRFIQSRAVLSSIIEFCEKSWRYNTDAEDVDVEAGETSVVFSPRGSNVIVGVFDVRLEGETLDRRSVSEMNVLYGRSWKNNTGKPKCYINKCFGQIGIYPVPDKDYNGALSCKIAMAPKMSVLRVDNMFYDYYLEPINCGAIARLLMQEGKSWFNPSLAPQFLGKFYNAIYSARNIVMRDVYQISPLPKML